MYSFEYPKMLYCLLVLVPMLAWYIYKMARGKTSLQLSSIAGFAEAKHGIRFYMQHIPFILRCLAVAALIFAIARPRSYSELETVDTEGIDIVLTLDVSTSMLARDFQPDRIEAAKNIAAQFITERKTDRIGLVVFAGESFTQCPLTTDHATLINLLQQVKTGMIEDMTAIGSGLATAVARIKDSNAKSRVIILLTDGVNNISDIPPIMAAEMAEKYKIRVYTIGVGKQGMAPYPVENIFGQIEYRNIEVEIDEKLLKEIADKTGGKYFRATNNTKLRDIYNEINQMEKTKTLVDSLAVYKEKFQPFALIALALLFLELILRMFILKILPSDV